MIHVCAKRLLILLFCSIWLGCSFSVRANGAFTFGRLTSEESLHLVSGAELTPHGVELTDVLGGKGAAYWAQRLPFHQGFESVFQFEIEISEGDRGGDGLVFIMQDQGPNAVGGGGEGIGYASSTAPAISPAIAVEFDTFFNPLQNDPNGNHAALFIENTADAAEPPNHEFDVGFITELDGLPLIADGGVFTAKVAYQPGELRLYVDDFNHPLGLFDVDLFADSQMTDQPVWIGFTAATGAAKESHVIQSWTHISGPASDAGIGECIVVALPEDSQRLREIKFDEMIAPGKVAAVADIAFTQDGFEFGGPNNEGLLAGFDVAFTGLYAGEVQMTIEYSDEEFGPGANESDLFVVQPREETFHLLDVEVDFENNNVVAATSQLGPTFLATEFGLSSDYNSDGVVDLFDFSVLKGNFGRTDAELATGDGDRNGRVDLLDFNLLKSHFGWRIVDERAPIPAPEPGAIVLVISSALIALVGASRRWRCAWLAT